MISNEMRYWYPTDPPMEKSPKSQTFPKLQTFQKQWSIKESILSRAN